MHEEGNVVPLMVAAQAAARARPCCLPSLLLQVRDAAAVQLRQSLQTLFERADAALFEMADSPVGESARSLSFDAIRDLRLTRSHIERAFIDLFYERFAGLGQGSSTPRLILAVGKRDPALAERDQAVAEMVDQVKSRDGHALAQLNQRFECLLQQPVGDAGQPMAPASLCEDFIAASRELGVPASIKRFLLGLFGRFLLGDCDLLYAEANQTLAAGGVLMHLAPVPRRRVNDQASANPCTLLPLHAGKTWQREQAARDLFGELQGLLSPWRGRLLKHSPGAINTRALGATELTRLLTHLQRYVPAVAATDDLDLPTQLTQLMQRLGARTGTRRCLSADDEDIFNLVSLMFAHIREDDNLPHSLRQLLARLHIPLLKVALADKTLLSRVNHPARRLLDEIAAAGLGWEAPEVANDTVRDGLQVHVERVVQRLLNEYADDVQLLEELLTEFLDYSNETRRRSELLEQRMRDAEAGRARARAARVQVEQALQRRLQGRVLPEPVVQMLLQGWGQVLLQAWLKDGGTGADWRAALATVDTLLASVAPHPSAAARSRLLVQVPGLLKALREGLAGIAVDSSLSREFFLALERLHLRACCDPSKWTTAPDDIQVHGPVVLAFGEMAHGSEEVPAPIAGDVQPTKACFDSHLLRRLRLGSWVVLNAEDQQVRCKLVAQLDADDRWVFSESEGLKVHAFDSAGLLQALHRGDIRVLEDGPLFTRALEAVRSRLQHG